MENVTATTRPAAAHADRTACAGFALSISLRVRGIRIAMTITRGRPPVDEGRYDAAKAAQVIAYLALKTASRTLEVLKAIKLVYLGDRESIARWGDPILNEPRHSLPHGPANTLTLTYVDGGGRDREGWSRYLEERRGHCIAARPGVSVADLDLLSEADAEILDDLWRTFGAMDRFDLRDWTHDPANVPEWRDPNGSRLPITLESIMRAVGIGDAAAQAARVESYRGIRDLIAGRG